jgi:hypothetical protein
LQVSTHTRVAAKVIIPAASAVSLAAADRHAAGVTDKLSSLPGARLDYSFRLPPVGADKSPRPLHACFSVDTTALLAWIRRLGDMPVALELQVYDFN